MSQTNVTKVNPADEQARRKAQRERLTLSPQLTMYCRSPYVALVHTRLKGLEMQVQNAGDLMGRGQITLEEYNEVNQAAMEVESFIRDRIKHIEKMIGKVRGRRPRRPGQLSAAKPGDRGVVQPSSPPTSKQAETGGQAKVVTNGSGAPKAGLADSGSLV